MERFWELPQFRNGSEPGWLFEQGLLACHAATHRKQHPIRLFGEAASLGGAEANPDADSGHVVGQGSEIVVGPVRGEGHSLGDVPAEAEARVGVDLSRIGAEAGYRGVTVPEENS